MQYRYALDKSSRKFACPLCGKKRLVRYIDLVKNEYINDESGRCDRETSCGYHKKPILNNDTIIHVPFVPKKTIVPDFHKKELVQDSNKKLDANNLAIFLSRYFAEGTILETLARYKIGTSRHWRGATVFWQIDQQDNIHAGKVILFDKYTGKRVKEPYPHINWVHRIINQKGFVLQQCLFGLQLVEKHRETIAIVEAEKTAVIMSMFMPDYIWLATGSKQNLKYDLLKPLINNEIIVFPDKGEFKDWRNKSEQLNKLGFSIRCSELVEKSSFEIGTDLADVYSHEFKTKNETIKEVAIQYTETEKAIQRIAKSNPEIWDLIATFDLIDEKGNGIRKV